MEVIDVFEHRGQFFRVLQETKHSQTAVMTIAPGADAGPEERHEGDQIIYVGEGDATVRIGEKEHRAGAGSVVSIAAGTRHHVCSSDPGPLIAVFRYCVRAV